VASLQIIVTADLGNLTSQSRNELESRLGRLADDLVRQAAYEEEVDRDPGVTTPEITRTHVRAAERVVRGSGRAVRRPSKTERVVAFLSAASSASVGVFAGVVQHSIWQEVAFILSLLIAVPTTWSTVSRGS
jgi:hypothetical protein